MTLPNFINALRRVVIAALVLAPLSAAPAMAQQMIAEYYTLLGPQDRFNSSGQPIGDFCGVVQQDRANFHRFGLRDDMDGNDPVFGAPAARAAMAGRCVVMPGFEYIPQMIASGQTRFIWVRVFGANGLPQRIEIREGAG